MFIVIYLNPTELDLNSLDNDENKKKRRFKRSG